MIINSNDNNWWDKQLFCGKEGYRGLRWTAAQCDGSVQQVGGGGEACDNHNQHPE